MKNVWLLCGAVAVAAVVAATVKNGEQPAPREAVSRVGAAPVGTSLDAPPLSPAAETSLAGEVREAIDVAQYTYLRILTQEGNEIWAAVSKAPVSVGSRVSIIDAARMTNFESATLKRTFDVIYFGNLGVGGASGPSGALPPGHPPLDGQGVANSPHGSAATPPLPSAVKVEPATGKDAFTIAALFAQRSSLEGKPARVRGQVVKATPVQGVTYYHLRDGSSTEPTASDLVIRSGAPAASGQIVTFEGLVRNNVDVGIGFAYPVLLQDARLVR
jgi:hypothetical protein